MNRYIAIILIAAVTLLAANKFQYAEIKVNSIDDIKFLQENKIDIDRTSFGKAGKPVDGKVTVYVTEEQYSLIEKNGYSMKWTPLQLPDKLTDFRHNTAIGDSMLIWQNRYPSICKRLQIGTSVQGRPLWVLKISDNVDTEEAEPEVKFVSTMHGDEVTGVEMELFFAENILKGYAAANDTMQFIVNNTELYIMPLMNPDGMENNSRYNANGLDLNRSFPDFVTGDPNSVSASQLPEIDAMINFSNGHNFILSTNYHGGALVANYILDTLPPLTSGQYAAAPDDLHATWLAANYAVRNTPMYNGSFTDGITNGLEWYEAVGGMQDWNYHYYDDMDLTLEISNTKWPSYSSIPGFWADNRAAMFWYLSASHKGIYGIVTDSVTGLPLDAKIEIAGIDKEYGTDPDLGDYYRTLKPGTYSMTVSAAGYYSQTVNNIIVTDNTGAFKEATEVNVQLVPEGDIGGTFTCSESSLSFGTVNVGYSSIHTFQITNSHSSEVLTGTITTPAGFSVAESSKSLKDHKNTLGYIIGSGSSKTFDLSFEPTAGQTYSGNVSITSSDSSHPTESISVSGTGIAPDINLNPASLSATTAPESSINKQFDIENTGIGTLDYSISINYTGGKEIKGSGEDLNFGYKWKDSDEAGGPAFNWVDITGIGTVVTLADDAESSAIPMDMDFPFYGVDYTTVVIADNGAVSFTGGDVSGTNATIPTSAAPNALVSPFWDDLNCSSTYSGDVYYYHDSANSRFIIEYYNIVDYGSTNTNTFEILLYESGKIEFQYGTLNGPLNECTVGIESPDGTDGCLVTYNSAYLKNNFAVQFQATPEWLSLDSNTGSIAGIGSDTITATCDATGLEIGTYTADIIISSNSPGESTVTLPVTFNVAYGETGGTFALNQTNLSYGNVGVGQNSVKQFTITNSHATEYLMGSITTIEGYTVAASAKEEAKNVLAYTVSPSSSKTFDLTFAPTASQAYSGNVTITSTDDAHATVYIAVSGTGTEPPFGIPFSEDFNDSSELPAAWAIVDNQGNGQVWQFGTHSSGLSGADGNYAYLNSDDFGSGNTQNADLVTPKIDMSNATGITVSFDYYFRSYTGSSGTFSYSIDGGSNWVQVVQWTADTTNPATFSQAIPALDGQANVKLKWNFTGTWGYYLDIDDVLVKGTVTQLEAPGNITTSISGSDLIIGWDDAAGAASYDVYSSDDPYGSFSFEANVTSSQYSVAYTEAKKFYYVVSKN